MRCLAVLLIGLPAALAGKSKGCSSGDTLQGTATLATFTACSSLSSSDIRATAQQLTKNKEMEKHLKTKAGRCEVLPTVDQKQSCLAGFMRTLAADHILSTDSSANNDDASAKDLVTTCSCLKTAIDSMPNCGTFSEFYEVDKILPTSQGVCADISVVCNKVSDFSKLCLDADAHFSFSPSTCSAVLATSDHCSTGAATFWAMGLSGSEYCGLKQWQLNRLENYEKGCPREGALVSVYSTASLQKFVAFVALLGAAAGACWHFRRRGGLVYRAPQAYKPLSMNELEGLSDGEEYPAYDAPQGAKAAGGYTLASASVSRQSPDAPANEMANAVEL